MYNERVKANTMKYLKERREALRLNLPKGTKDVWKAYAADRGISVTELLTRLITEDMEKHNWTKEPESETETQDQTAQPEESDDSENGA